MNERISAAIVLGGALLLGACAAGMPRQNEGAVSDFEGPVRAQPGYSGLSGSARAVTAPGTTAVFINLNGAEPGATYGWQVQHGRCGSGGGPVAQADLPNIRPGPDGSVRLTASIPLQLSRGREYHVNVLLSPERPDVVVACAQLTG